MYSDDGFGFINTFVKTYGKACLTGQLVLHMDSNSIWFQKGSWSFSLQVCIGGSAGGSNGKLTGVFAQDAQGPGPNPQCHSWKTNYKLQTLLGSQQEERIPGKQLPHDWRDRWEQSQDLPRQRLMNGSNCGDQCWCRKTWGSMWSALRVPTQPLWNPDLRVSFNIVSFIS